MTDKRPAIYEYLAGLPVYIPLSKIRFIKR
ncbi:hypothetical protein SAMN05216378_0617 [Paenibacillus catalpae]|uniref:Uncharacterized protein n=1 Tax=Paenibacillus catalpae TaxID=1045775 RepID=A0A1I1TPR9_9BACL|nr:hypothetical protein SAMN05216378_0617 [Paenibacillus catalpae]